MIGLSKKAQINGLSFLWLEITEKCNLECGHCYTDSSPRKELLGRMDTEDWFTVIKESAEMGCREIQFIGGEPTLHPDLPRLISQASLQGYSFIEVFTNSTHISESLMEVFLKHGVHVATSFYSDDPVVHDKVTNRQNSFYRTVDGIKRCLDSELPIRIGIIEMEENVGHVNRAKVFLEKLGALDISIGEERAVGRGARNIQPTNPIGELCGECWKGKLCVTSSGKAYPCVFSRFAELGQAKDGIREIVESKSLMNFRRSLRNFKNETSVCEPDICSPTRSSCGPEFKCMPATQPCSPATRCVPVDRCSPDIRGIRI